MGKIASLVYEIPFPTKFSFINTDPHLFRQQYLLFSVQEVISVCSLTTCCNCCPIKHPTKLHYRIESKALPPDFPCTRGFWRTSPGQSEIFDVLLLNVHHIYYGKLHSDSKTIQRKLNSRFHREAKILKFLFKKVPILKSEQKLILLYSSLQNHSIAPYAQTLFKHQWSHSPF